MLFGEHGLRAYLALRSERDQLQEAVDVLEVRHDGLEEDLSSLESDDATLERIAREKYRMRREGETVIEVVGEDEGVRPGADEMDAGDS
jgi:cell division protein FtsB